MILLARWGSAAARRPALPRRRVLVARTARAGAGAFCGARAARARAPARTLLTLESEKAPWASRARFCFVRLEALRARGCRARRARAGCGRVGSLRIRSGDGATRRRTAVPSSPDMCAETDVEAAAPADGLGDGRRRNVARRRRQHLRRARELKPGLARALRRAGARPWWRAPRRDAMAARDHPALPGTTRMTTQRTHAPRRRAGARDRTPRAPARARWRPRRSASRPSTRRTGRWMRVHGDGRRCGPDHCLARERSWLVAAGSHALAARTRGYSPDLATTRCPAILRAASALSSEHERHHHANRISDATVPVQLRALIQVNKARYGRGFAACAKLMPGTAVEVSGASAAACGIYILRRDAPPRTRAPAQLPRDETDEDFSDKPDGGSCCGSARAARMRAREHARAPPEEKVCRVTGARGAAAAAVAACGAERSFRNWWLSGRAHSRRRFGGRRTSRHGYSRASLVRDSSPLGCVGRSGGSACSGGYRRR